MAAVHVPTPVSHAVQEPLGYNGAAEGFIFLSACLTGWAYGKTYRQENWQTMSQRIWNRTRLIYGVHLVVLLPITIIVWTFANQAPPFANHFHDFLVHPWGALVLMPLLLHQPPFFDILPLYVIFLGLTPWLLAAARRGGWGIVIAISTLGWIAAQFHPAAQLIGADPTRWLPLRLGSFDLLAWQFLWVCGVAIGETNLPRLLFQSPFRPLLTATALVVVLAGFSLRHKFWPLAWWNPDPSLVDKWALGPVRLLDFTAWVVLLLTWNPHPAVRSLEPLALLGRHSLAVFALHLPLVIAATAVIQMLALSDAWQVVVAFAVIELLFPWAAWLDRKQRDKTRTANFKTPFSAIQPG